MHFIPTGSYPQQAVYPQQSTAPIYPPAMQVQPTQAPPYSDAPPAYSEVSGKNQNGMGPYGVL